MYVYKNRAETELEYFDYKEPVLGYINRDKQANYKKNYRTGTVLSFCLLDPDPINCNYKSGSNDSAVLIKNLKGL